MVFGFLKYTKTNIYLHPKCLIINKKQTILLFKAMINKSKIIHNLNKMKISQKINTITLFLCLVSIKLYSQEANGFYLTKDTIKISDPIIISVKGKAGKIITSSQEYNKVSNIEKLLNDNKAFLYFDDGMGLGFYINDIWKKNNFKISECDCCDKKNTIVKGNKTLTKLSLTRFYLGFTKVSFYNRKTVTIDKKKFLIKNKENFYPILFPLCD